MFSKIVDRLYNSLVTHSTNKMLIFKAHILVPFSSHVANSVAKYVGLYVLGASAMCSRPEAHRSVGCVCLQSSKLCYRQSPVVFFFVIG